MYEGFEQWVKESNPHQCDENCRNVCRNCNIPTKQKNWEEGAVSMAEHLLSLPPTFEQIDKSFKIVSKCGLSRLENESENEFNCRLYFYIHQHWNDTI